MKILLDTCAIIWAVSKPSSLSEKATNILQYDTSQIFVSPISVAEIACGVERGRIRIAQHWKKWFRHFVELNGWQVNDIDLRIIEEAYSLPTPFHQDPADRILVATARLNDSVLLTADKKILDYPHVNGIW
jgi:PIN domain nuclease of toxin-antitoxin system